MDTIISATRAACCRLQSRGIHINTVVSYVRVTSVCDYSKSLTASSLRLPKTARFTHSSPISYISQPAIFRLLATVGIVHLSASHLSVFPLLQGAYSIHAADLLASADDLLRIDAI